jgi:hypothetical protein
LAESKLRKVCVEIARDISLLPVRIISILVVSALPINAFFSVLLRKEINTYGWIMRGVIFLLGICGLFCDADLEKVKCNSVVYRFFIRKQR